MPAWHALVAAPQGQNTNKKRNLLLTPSWLCVAFSQFETKWVSALVRHTIKFLLPDEEAPLLFGTVLVAGALSVLGTIGARGWTGEIVAYFLGGPFLSLIPSFSLASAAAVWERVTVCVCVGYEKCAQQGRNNNRDGSSCLSQTRFWRQLDSAQTLTST